MSIRAGCVIGFTLSLVVGCGSVSTLGGHGGSGGQATGGAGTGGQATGGSGTGGSGTGGSGTGGLGTGGAAGGRGGHAGGGAGTGGHGGAGTGGHGGAGSGGHGGGSGGNKGRGGAGGANGGPCWATTDCGGGAICTLPGATVCGGACIGPQHPCTTDSDCAGDAAVPSVCDTIPCSCPTAKGCVPGCATQNDCPEGQTCSPSNHRCIPISCAGTLSGCPANFTCVSGGDAPPLCMRKSCQTDADCPASCVFGACYGAPGTCRLPAP